MPLFGLGSPKPAAGRSAGRPLHLLRYDETSKSFELGEEALDALRAIRGPVGVLAVCGRARQGKSFILNQLVGTAAAESNGEGFKVGPTVKPCTKGLWIWSDPIKRTAPSGETYHLVLLDTEGIDAYDQTGQYSTQIFSMAVLLSSLFCYNQMGGIDEAALDRLSLVTEMTKHIRVRSAGAGASDPSELARFSPSFVWLLRDFYLDLDDDEQGGAITPAQYLESALRNVPGRGASVEAKNSIRDSIRGLFPERECFPLVRPVNDEKQLRSLDTVPKSQLRPEFRKGLDDLIAMLFARCRPKTVGPDVLNGPALAGMAKQYVAAINGGAVPAIATAWQSVAETECRRAAEAAEAAYEATFYPAADEAAAEESALLVLHNEAMEAARATFAERAVGGAEMRRPSAGRLEETLAKRHAAYAAKRKAEAAAKCVELLTGASQRVLAAANGENATVDGVLAAVESEVETYLARAEGSVRHERLSVFLKDVMRFALGSLAERNSQSLVAKLERETVRAESALGAAATEKEARREAEERARRAEEKQRQTEAKLSECEAKMRAAEANVASANAQLREEKQERKATDAGAAMREASLREALDIEKGRSERLAEENRRVGRELSEWREEVTRLQANKQSESMSLEYELRAANERLAEANRQRQGRSR